MATTSKPPVEKEVDTSNAFNHDKFNTEVATGMAKYTINSITRALAFKSEAEYMTKASIEKSNITLLNQSVRANYINEQTLNQNRDISNALAGNLDQVISSTNNASSRRRAYITQLVRDAYRDRQAIDMNASKEAGNMVNEINNLQAQRDAELEYLKQKAHANNMKAIGELIDTAEKAATAGAGGG